MVDVVDAATRSRMMAGIRSKNTKPEIAVRRMLHAEGLRFRLHDRTLPGTPDLVFRRYQAVIFVSGCFWHGHDCRLFRIPASRTEFWDAKIARNRNKDLTTREELEAAGWRHATVWECALRGAAPESAASMAAELADWVRSGQKSLELRGER